MSTEAQLSNSMAWNLHGMGHEYTSSPSVHRLMLWLCTHAAWRRRSVCGRMCAHAQSTSSLHRSQQEYVRITQLEPCVSVCESNWVP